MTVPGLKHARHLANVIQQRLPDGPKLEVIVNRFEQRPTEDLELAVARACDWVINATVPD